MSSRDDDIETMPEGDLMTIPSDNIPSGLLTVLWARHSALIYQRRIEELNGELSGAISTSFHGSEDPTTFPASGAPDSDAAPRRKPKTTSTRRTKMRSRGASPLRRRDDRRPRPPHLRQLFHQRWGVVCRMPVKFC